jgi:type VI secretion system protein ImpG
MDGRSEAYPVTPSQPGLVIYSIDKVSLMSRNGDRALQPFHGTAHTEPGPYWQLDESEGFALNLVDREQRPARLETGVISVQLTCTNTELPKPASRLTTEASAGGFPIRFTHAPALPAALPAQAPCAIASMRKTPRCQPCASYCSSTAARTPKA